MAANPLQRASLFWTLGAAVLVCGACLAGAAIGTWLRFPRLGTAVLFPPYAILTGALLVSPTRRWWIFLLASSLGNLWPHLAHGASLSFFLMAEAANYARALAAAHGVRRFGVAAGGLDTLRGMAIFLLFAVALGPLVGASIGAGAVVLHHGTASYWLAFRPWLLSNTLTGLTLLPVVYLGLGATRRQPAPRRLVEGLALVLGLSVVSALVFLSTSPLGYSLVAPLYAPLLLLLWAAVRFGPGGASAGLLVLTGLAIWGTLAGRGPFVSASPEENLLHLQAFLFVLSVPFLLLSALIRDQQRTSQALQTQRILADTLRDSDRCKDEFLAMLAHELRNPLAAISMVVGILDRMSLAERQVIWAREVIGRQVQQLTRLIDDLLDVSRITSGTVQLRMESVGLGQVIASAIETSRPLFAPRELRLTTSLPPASPLVRGDPARLAQLFSNLLNNAAKYSPDGGEVCLSLEQQGDWAMVRLADHGAGIPRDMLDRVFEPFVQVDRARDGALGGLGLGLMLARRIVQLHGGSIEAHSAGPGCGSEFVVRLPTSAAAEVVPAPHEAAPRPRASAPRRILVVDDAVDVAEALAGFLSLQGHQVYVVHDGAAALDTASRCDYDVVLLDLELPKIDGLEVARQLRAQHGCRQMLIAATTGYGQAADFRRTAEAGFDHHLTKPFDLSDVEALLRSRPHSSSS